VVRPLIRESEILKEASMPFEIGPLAAALVFSAIFLLGSHVLIPEAIRRHRRRILSFGAGVTIAYVFVHLLPELEAARAALVRSGAHLSLPFPALRVYLAALAGFMVFYGLEHLAAWTRRTGGLDMGQGEETRRGRSIHVGGFLLYVWLAGYLAVRSLEEGPTPVALYAVALGLHFLSLDFSLSNEYGAWYQRSVRYIFAFAPLAGWAVGLFVGFGQTATAALLGFLSGGVIMNAVVSELPKEKDGRLMPFLFGGAFYTALLIILS
jgi:zinc transporter ZupT